jgi:hypothetical protein
MTVRAFNGTSDALSVGGSFGTFNTAAKGASLVLIAKPLTNTGVKAFCALGTTASSSTMASLYQLDDDEYAWGTDDPAGDSHCTVTPTANVWAVIAITKAPGTSTPRAHWKQLGTGAWTRADGTATAAANAGTAATRLYFATFTPTLSNFRDMRIAVGALYDKALADSELTTIETAATSAALNAAGAIEIVEFNQASNATAVTCLKGVGSQASISGTTVVTGDDPAWTYGLSAAPADPDTFVRIAGAWVAKNRKVRVAGAWAAT